MKPWRVVMVGLLGAALAAGLFTGPEGLRIVLFWLYFFALPGGLAVRFLDIRSTAAYLLAGAICGSLGLIGLTYPVSPSFTGVWVPALVGAVFGLGWRFLLNLKYEHRSEASPIQRTVSWWNG